MKLIALLLALTVHATASAKSYSVHCKTQYQNEYIQFEFWGVWTPNEQLTEVEWILNEDLGEHWDTQLVDYNPTNPKYEGMNRFILGKTGFEDSSILLPKEFPATPKKFTGYHWSAGGDGMGKTKLLCDADQN